MTDEPTRVDELIDDLCDAIGEGRVVELEDDDALRFAWYVAATRWLWMEA